jgi:hypothetical protein
MHTWRISRLLLLVCVGMCLCAPAVSAASDGVFICRFGDLFIRTELFFGLGRANGPDVTEEEFRLFLRGSSYSALSRWINGVNGTGAISQLQGGH